MRQPIRTTWVCAVLLVLARPAASDVLQEADELRQQMHYDAARTKLEAALPGLEDEARARALMLLAAVNDDPKEARRQLLDAGKAASRPPTRRTAILELAKLDYGRGNYRSVQARLQEIATDPEAALWLGLAAVALGERTELRSTLEPARKLDLGQLLLAWTDLQDGQARQAVETLQPLAGQRRGDLTATALLWKAQSEIALGDHESATRTVALLRDRWPTTPEAHLSEPLVAGGAPDTERDAGGAERLALQVGSFEDRANALRYREQMRGTIQDVRIEESTSGATRLYRVVVGSFPSRETAEAFAAQQLTSRGIAWQVVRLGEAAR